MERMLAAMGNPAVEEVDVGDAERILAMAGPQKYHRPMSGSVRMGLVRPTPDASILFNTFVWDEADRAPVDPAAYNDHASRRIARLMAGVGDDFAFSRRDTLTVAGVRYVCQGGWGIHSLQGCLHKCAYCYEGFIDNIMLDLEDFAEQIRRVIVARPQQKLYRYDMYSDSICLEPEYGASAILSKMFADMGDKYLLYYTKSDNVDHLLELPHKENAIFYLTLAAETACHEIEQGTPSMTRRIEALRKCQQAGYRVRVGFSPIIPTPNWRREATECLEQLFAAVRPETVRLWVLSLMDPETADHIFGNGLLDEEFLASIRHNTGYRPEEVFNQPFPHEARAAIYRHYIDEIRRISPETPLSLCSERRELWDMLADRLVMSPDKLFCCCGGMSV
jgi:spore photoproduct lyase